MSETNKIKVEICLGTTCYVLGSFRLSALEEQLPPELKSKVDIVGCACLNVCHDRNYGEAYADLLYAPEKVIGVIQEIVSAGGTNE